MIFVRDKGRMCNNILQYGHLYAWGREHGRQTVSMRFSYKYQWFHICHTRYHNFLTYVLAKYAAKWHLLPVADFGLDAPASDYDAQEKRLLSHRHVVAEGWYARWYHLFLKYKSEIVALFQFDAAVCRNPNRLLASLPEGGLRVGLHIRRGDYRRWYGGRYYYTDEQYIKVLSSYLATLAPSPLTLFVCGNDPELDEDAFRRAFPGATVLFPKGNPAEDLYLLSRCDRLIGAPSTFSLVASMYRDVPLYWIESADAAPVDADFGHFDQMFQQIK